METKLYLLFKFLDLYVIHIIHTNYSLETIKKFKITSSFFLLVRKSNETWGKKSKQKNEIFANYKEKCLQKCNDRNIFQYYHTSVGRRNYY